MKGAALSATLHAVAITGLAMMAEATSPLPFPPTVTVVWLSSAPVAAEQTTQPASRPAAAPTLSRASRRSSPNPAMHRPSPAALPAPENSTPTSEPSTANLGSEEAAPSAQTSATAGPIRDAQYELGAADTPLPEYPWSARRRNREGRVVVRLMVAADGNVLSAEVVESSGDAALDGTARDTLSGWRLRPALANGIPVATHIDVPIRFELHLQARL